MYDTIIIAMLTAGLFGEATITRFISNYTRREEEVIVATRTSTEEVVIVDTTGNEWRLYETSHEKDDMVTITMNKSNTNNIIKNVTINTY